MKRQHIIERLVAANYTTAKVLNGLTNDHLHNLYFEVWPRIHMRVDRIKRRDKRIQIELETKRRFEKWQEERCKNWVHPKVKYPLTGPGRIYIPQKHFGINELASMLVQTLAETTQKITKGNENTKTRGHRTGKRFRNGQGRFRINDENRIRWGSETRFGAMAAN